MKFTKQPVLGRLGGGNRAEGKGVEVGGWSKERQLKEYRRVNGPCFTCGEKFEPGHQARCQRGNAVQLHVLVPEDMEKVLTPEVLEQIEQEEKQEEEELKLSLNAINGDDDSQCIRLRALIQHQMLLMLVDSRSSTNFIRKQMVEKLKLEVEECDLVKVKVASGDIMVSTQRVREVKWWTGGHTFVFPMRVLDIRVYDSILGFDWLRAHSPMNCD
jgi:hypothetical protein